MPTILRVLLVALPMAMTSVGAHALTLTNMDRTVHTLAILEEDDEWSATIGPGETLQHLCHSPCYIAINPEEEREFEGHEEIKIRDGRLHFRR